MAGVVGETLLTLQCSGNARYYLLVNPAHFLERVAVACAHFLGRPIRSAYIHGRHVCDNTTRVQQGAQRLQAL